MPALGMAIKGRLVAAAMHSMAVSTVAGPTLQLQPIASAPHSVRRIAAVSAEEPSRQLASSSTVTITRIGSEGAVDFAARMACSASFNAETVSISSRSTPPSTRPRICWEKASSASSRLIFPKGSRRAPRGPTAPATQTLPLCFSARWFTALRAISAPARLISMTLSPKP